MIPELRDAAQLIQEITAASAEQAQGSEQMNGALRQMNSIVQENASVSEELASMAEELNAQAEGMSTAVQFFKLKNAGGQARVNLEKVQRTKPQSVRKKQDKPEAPAPEVNEQLMIEDNDFEEF